MPRLCSSLLLSLVIASSASAVTMDWTPIGNPGNACDADGCFGAVGYAYNIGTYEVTNAQYAEFLNAKAASDSLALYNTNMGQYDPANDRYGGITRTGSAGSYSYSTIAGRAEMPVTYVSFYDTLRFANWMNNGQGAADTETGAYTLLGGTAIPGNGETVTRNPGATIVLTSDEEWYKAAYHDAIGLAPTDYFDYPAGSNTQIGCVAPTAAPNRANCDYAVGPNGDLTAVGSYTGSASPYGTFDQGGNVSEWNEGIFGGSYRTVRGGGFTDPPMLLWAGLRIQTNPTIEFMDIGFRVAMVVPEPGTGLLAFAGLLGLAGWRRARA